MKPKTKKTIIIIVAVAAVAVIIWLLFFRKKDSASIIDKLDVSPKVKNALKQKLAEIEVNASGVSGWTKDEIKRKAAENGYTYAQWMVVEAAFALYNASDWNLYNNIATAVKTM